MSSAQEGRAPGGPVPDGLVIDDETVHIPGPLDTGTTYDVLLNERHVWSLEPGRDTTAVGSAAVARWPKALRRYLVGHAVVLVREHVSGRVVASGDHAFAGNEDAEVEVVDKDGNSLVLDKWGRLIRPLGSDESSIVDELLREVERLLRVLREEAGVPAFICYGTLLGAVRDGRLIGHDNDVDVAYLSELPYPVDVVREGYRIERVLLDAGWAVRRGSGVRLNVRVRLGDGSMRFIDVFTAHWVEGVLYIPSDTGFELPRETILPLGTVELHGHAMPAPAQPEELLAATYGPRWRVPDPSFRYQTPRWLSRRLGGWFGGLMTARKHWDAFHGRPLPAAAKSPSPFARWVARTYPSDRPLVDVGSGKGRDTFFFAGTLGRRVLALDYSTKAVVYGARRARVRAMPATFDLLNLCDTRAVLALGARLAREPEPVDVYVRFTLHDLEEHGRSNVLRLASMSLRRGGLLFLEFRTTADAGRPHVFADHPRHYLQPEVVRAQIEAAGGRVLHEEQGTGLARFQDEDPVMCRMVASWSEGGAA